MARLTPEERRARAADHESSGRDIIATRGEWAAVALFYSAYHLMNRAIELDPVFDTVDGLRRCNSNLQMDDRYPEVHKARRGQGRVKPGVNDLAATLYPRWAPDYERLHQASIGVRYERRLRAPLAVVLELFETVKAASDAGALVWSDPSGR